MSTAARPASATPSYTDRAATSSAPVLHLTGPILLGPEQERGGAWVVDGRVHHERPELPAGAEVRTLDGPVVPGLADLHCHIGISDEGKGTTLDLAREQARTDRDPGVLLIRDAGSITDTAALQAEADLPRIVRAGRHVARTRRYLIGYAHEVDPEQLPGTIAAEARRGDGWVKLVGDWIDRSVGDLTPTWSAADFRAAAEAAHAHGARITTHTFDEATLPLVLDAGFDCLEHATGLTDDTIARAAAAGVPVVTTLVNVDEFETYAAQGERKFPAYAAPATRTTPGCSCSPAPTRAACWATPSSTTSSTSSPPAASTAPRSCRLPPGRRAPSWAPPASRTAPPRTCWCCPATRVRTTPPCASGATSCSGASSSPDGRGRPQPLPPAPRDR